MITLYGNATVPNSIKVHAFLYETGHNFQFKSVDLRKMEQKLPDYLAKNPVGKVPLIDDDGFFLAESNTIMRYLATKWQLSDLYPIGLKERAQVDQWSDFISLHINQMLGKLFLNRVLVPKFFGTNPDLHEIAMAERLLPGFLRVLEDQLVGRNYLLSSGPTIADFVLTGFLPMHKDYGLSLSDYPHTQRWLEHMTNRDSWKKFKKL